MAAEVGERRLIELRSAGVDVGAGDIRSVIRGHVLAVYTADPAAIDLPPLATLADDLAAERVDRMMARCRPGAGSANLRRCRLWYPRERPKGKGIAVSQVTNEIRFPPVVYVPCSPLDPEDAELSVDLRQTRDGKTALLVYSALDRLVTCCGEQQPWVVLPAADLEKIREKTDFELILLDIEIPDEFRRQEGEIDR